MEIVKLAVEWAKDEVLSSKIFILFGILFIITSVGFWQLGKTEVARAFIYPVLIAGILLLAAGVSFYFSNKSRVSNFKTEYKANPSGFISSEIKRTEKTINEYRNTAFKVFPVIIAIAAITIIFIDKPIWRAICITVIAFMTILLWIDSNALSRIETYQNELKSTVK